jgi:hypothetical protein
MEAGTVGTGAQDSLKYSIEPMEERPRKVFHVKNDHDQKEGKPLEERHY